MDEIIKDQLDAVRYQKTFAAMHAHRAATRMAVKQEQSFVDDSGNEYEDDSYITDEMLEELRIKADNE